MQNRVIPVPAPAQLQWQTKQLGVFFHFGPNTFHNKEWSDGTLPAQSFDPDDLDVDEWVAATAQLGAKYAVLTAKHHDGFCLWPTETTDYSVASCPWRGGRGDLVQEFTDACRRHGLDVGIYVSPWDRHDPRYEDPLVYSPVYCEQVRELCTRYGKISELWFDGAGSEGYEYDWLAIMSVVKTTQPEAMVFNMGEPTIRWIGNEDGLASDPVEYAVLSTRMSNYTDETEDLADVQYPPPECDVSIRRGWFWSADDEPKSLGHLLAIYYRSVGMGANLLLNVPPDYHGRIDPGDSLRLRELGVELDRRFGNPTGVPMRRLAEGHWEGQATQPFDHLVLREQLEDGQRITSHRVMLDGVELAFGMTVGSNRLYFVGSQPAGLLEVVLEGDEPKLESVSTFSTGVSKEPTIPEDYTAPTDTPLE